MDPDEVNGAYTLQVSDLQWSGDDLWLNITNSLWADHETRFKEEFLQSSRTSYRAMIENIDLEDPEAPDLINAWVHDTTQGRIGPVIDTIDPEVVLYLINTMFFKGRWTAPFDTSLTRLREFTLGNGTRQMVPTMVSGPEDARYYEGRDFKAARLDYGDGRASMYLFVPDEGSSLREFYARLRPDNWARWLSGFKTGPAVILLPRFTLQYDAVLNKPLMALGMRRAFGGADFGRMTSERVFISKVKHTTMLEVNEEGTEAGSAALVELKKGPATRLAFMRPFCLAVVDNATGAVLLIGTVARP
jgi:serpin B